MVCILSFNDGKIPAKPDSVALDMQIKRSVDFIVSSAFSIGLFSLL